MVVLHYTAMRRCAEALERLCDPAHEVSAHYLISERGQVFALVPEEARAWHAGAGRWGAVTDVNSRSIGIELANPGDAPFAAPQMAALEQLLRAVLGRHRIPPERVIGHSDMAPARKADPGRRFDWRRLALQRLSVWPAPDRRQGGQGASAALAASRPTAVAGPGPAAASDTVSATDTASAPGTAAASAAGEAAFVMAAAAFGYDPAEGCGTLLAAFRRRFRPWAAGPLVPEDLAAMRDLARRFPVDRAAARA